MLLNRRNGTCSCSYKRDCSWHSQFVLQALGLTKPERERQHFLKQVFKSMDGDVAAEITDARNTNHSLGGPDWFKVHLRSTIALMLSCGLHTPTEF
jgi:hypothetical protein